MRHCLLQAMSPFLIMFSTAGLCGNGLIVSLLQTRQNFRLIKIQRVCRLILIPLFRFVFYGKENIVIRGENAGT